MGLVKSLWDLRILCVCFDNDLKKKKGEHTEGSPGESPSLRGLALELSKHIWSAHSSQEATSNDRIIFNNWEAPCLTLECPESKTETIVPLSAPVLRLNFFPQKQNFSSALIIHN